MKPIFITYLLITASLGLPLQATKPAKIPSTLETIAAVTAAAFVAVERRLNPLDESSNERSIDVRREEISRRDSAYLAELLATHSTLDDRIAQLRADLSKQKAITASLEEQRDKRNTEQ